MNPNKTEAEEIREAEIKRHNLYVHDLTYGEKLIDEESIAGLKEKLRYRQYLREKTRGILSTINRIWNYIIGENNENKKA